MGAIKNHFKDKEVVGIELGVLKAEHAEEILRLYPEVTMLHLIDSFKCGDSKRVEADANLAGNEDRFTWHVKVSHQAVLEFEDCSMDFIYIDADHSYEGVKYDVNAWWPKVKMGGIIGGHDYNMGWEARAPHETPTWRNAHGVVTAVNEFVEQNKLDLGSATDGSQSDWWVIKR